MLSYSNNHFIIIIVDKNSRNPGNVLSIVTYIHISVFPLSSTSYEYTTTELL